MIPRRLSLLPVLALLAGCGSPPPPEGAVRVASAADVAQCRYVIDINNKMALNAGTLGQKAEAYGRQAMMRQAADAGANTIVFGTVPGDLSPTGITATGYRC